MSLAAEELMVALLAVGLFASTTSLAVRAESKAGAWVSVTAFLWFSLLAVRLLLRLI